MAEIELADGKVLTSEEDVVWMIGWLADNAPADLLIPPRLAHLVKHCRSAYELTRFTVGLPLHAAADVLERESDR